jgi:uncharacterized membrane protein
MTMVFDLLTLITMIGSALIAGVFFIFSVCIMRALGTLSPPQGIAAMQSINTVIINPWFLSVFVGTALACAVTLVMSVVRWDGASTAGPLIGSLLYLVGAIVVTGRCNIPRNDALAAVAPDSADGAALWVDYLGTWTFWNHVRTLAALAATLAFAIPYWFR